MKVAMYQSVKKLVTYFKKGMDMKECMEGLVLEQKRQKVKGLLKYISGGLTTTVDYPMMDKQDRKYIWNAKAIPGDEAVSQLHLLLIGMKLKSAMKVWQVDVLRQIDVFTGRLMFYGHFCALDRLNGPSNLQR